MDDNYLKSWSEREFERKQKEALNEIGFQLIVMFSLMCIIIGAVIYVELFVK